MSGKNGRVGSRLKPSQPSVTQVLSVYPLYTYLALNTRRKETKGLEC